MKGDHPGTKMNTNCRDQTSYLHLRLFCCQDVSAIPEFIGAFWAFCQFSDATRQQVTDAEYSFW